MPLQWTTSAERDLVRLHAFLATINPYAGAEQLLNYPQLGLRLEEFSPRDVRRVIIGDYELRYELSDKMIYILRLWHGREDR